MNQIPTYDNVEGKPEFYWTHSVRWGLKVEDGMFLLRFDDGTAGVYFGSPELGWFGGFPYANHEEAETFFEELYELHRS